MLRQLRERYYSPGLGRFISADEIRGHLNDSQYYNRYVYCRNSPLNATDPSGRTPLSALLTVGGMIVGFFAGLLTIGEERDLGQISNHIVSCTLAGGAIGLSLSLGYGAGVIGVGTTMFGIEYGPQAAAHVIKSLTPETPAPEGELFYPWEPGPWGVLQWKELPEIIEYPTKSFGTTIDPIIDPSEGKKLIEKNGAANIIAEHAFGNNIESRNSRNLKSGSITYEAINYLTIKYGQNRYKNERFTKYYGR